MVEDDGHQVETVRVVTIFSSGESACYQPGSALPNRFGQLVRRRMPYLGREPLRSLGVRFYGWSLRALGINPVR
ncbi:MAG: hypothetical protein V3T33_07155 [Myxococcota bacterium]